MFARFKKDRSGNFGMLTAIMLVPIFGTVGLALDYGTALMSKTQLQDAADAAALAAISEKSAGVQKALEMTGDGEVAVGAEYAKQFFAAQSAGYSDLVLNSVDAKVVKKDNILTASVELEATLYTTFSRIIGQKQIKMHVRSTAEYQTQTFSDFYLLLDNTPSMGVGATPSDVAKMVASTSDKCAFACHIVKSGVEDKKSYYNLAKSLGVSTRINVVAQATASLRDTAQESRRSANQYRMAVYTFGEKAEDTKLLEVVSLTSDLADAKKNAGKIELMSIPYQGYDNDQQTNFDRALTQIPTKIGTPGTGLTSASPEKILYFVSDGVGDSYKPSTCTKKTTGGRCQEPIDISYCTALKNKGYKIAVLYTTYLPLPTNNWYNTWIAPFQSQIGSNMEACASSGLYFEVSPTEGITEAMEALFKKIITSPRLTS
ncbi:TadE/TadG family type IV pilus assembly protein [Pararhizobium arenae]|uniref:TadE/TadG family type IV pilus assembly protein n=1 Tax=Pararhizobium arenae TaxID=1856850 RepID=UPI00094AD244|nr:pilus assembly protein TadG-related protein [Pararhizobium arenae]